MKILIVDDNHENIEMLTILLSSQTHEVLSAFNGKEALEQARSTKIDLIISDILMPVMDGFQFCRECKKDSELSKVCFIFYTATYIDVKDEEFALSLGAQKFIRKPQEPEDLLKMINTIAENSCQLDASTVTTVQHDETEVLKLYSERLVAKLEKKNVDLEHEIASRRLTEKKLKESEERFSLAVDSIQNGLWDWNVATGYVYKSDYYARMLGFEPEELDNSVDAWIELLHPEDKEDVIKKNTDYLAGKIDEYEATYRLKNKNNQYRWIYSRGKALFGEDGKAYRFIGFNEDITTKKKIEEDLRESEERFRYIFEHSTIGKSLISVDGKFLRVNDTFAQMLGYSIEEMLQLNLEDVTYPDDSGRNEKCMNDLLTHKREKYRMEKRYLHKNGSIIWADVNSSLFRDTSGTPKYFITNINDITEKKKQEQELIKAKEKAEESDRLKTAFLHNISHEIRTPLNGIIGFSDIITKPDLDPEKQKKFSQFIRDGGTQLLSIVEDIMNIASIESGSEKSHEEESNINELLQMLNNQLFLKSSKKNLSYFINTSLTEDEATIWVDKIKLYQVLANLVNNAIKFTMEGYVKVNCWRKNGLIEFSVEDSGIGIAPEMHEKIFERFFQVEYGNTRLYGGTGLGLSIVKSYVEFLKGTIRLNSKPGKGSTFVVSIPYKPVKQPLMEISDNRLEVKPKASSTVLIVDDEPANILLLDEYLSDMELTVIHATDGIQAVEACKNNPLVSVILMDLKMPRMGGYEASRQIKSFRPDVSIIIQSAYVNQSDEKKEAVAAYIDGFIEKPIKPDVLIEMMQKAMA